jgi:hypothetical protein
MGRPGTIAIAIASTCLALLGACAADPPLNARDAADANDTGQTLGAKSESERNLLRQLATLPNSAAKLVGDTTVIAEAPYQSASGRTCRSLQLSRHQTTTLRLACNDGKGWFFVPDVFAGGGAE